MPAGFASGRRQDRVPWKQIKEHTADFIDARYLPEQPLVSQVPPIDDPSDMKKEQVVRLIEHWRRPVPGSDLFRFRNVLVNSKTNELTPALYEDSLGPHTIGKSSQALNVVVESGRDWDEEYQAMQFSPGPDDVNMHDSSNMVDARPEPVIDPQLLMISQPTVQPPTQGAKSKKPTKAKAGRKAKSKATQKKKQPVVIPDELPEAPIESRPRPKPQPKNPHLMGQSTGLQLESVGLPGPTSVFQPTGDQPAQSADIPPPADHPVHTADIPPPADHPVQSAVISPPAAAQSAPVSTPADQPNQSGPAQSEALDQSGRGKRQPVKRKLDACIALQFREAEEREAKDREKLLKRKAQNVVQGEGSKGKRQRIN